MFPLLTGRRLIKYVLMGILSGIFSFLFVNFVTRIVSLLIANSFSGTTREYAILFALLILLFIWTRRGLSMAITRLSQNLFWDLRKQIIALVLKANYQQIVEKRNNVYSAILNDVQTLQDASLSVISFFTSGVLAISCLVYLFSISTILFGITLGIALLGMGVYHFSSARNMRQFQKARQLENEFQENFTSILHGFKEISLEPKKGKYIFEQRISAISVKSYGNNMSAFTGFINNQITGQILFYILIGSILLFFSTLLKIKPSDTVSFVFTLLYLLGSIETIMVLLPGVARARVAANHMLALKKDIEQANFNSGFPDKYISKDEFEQVDITDLEFQYNEGEKGFSIGPICFSFRKGETIFIYGGNGSGKTTFINALLGLCMPSAGEIRLNGEPVNSDEYPRYRTIFSAVFSDFYLFKGLWSIDNPDMEKWDYLIELFELKGKVSLEEKNFSTTDLSTGQRKRLALIAALMEKKPVLIIDEWAADQDPHFRRKFYTEIIPMLKKEEVTIIAITHDDRYYHCADRLFKMDYGKLTEETVSVLSQPVLA